ncbi:uncharacterized protein BDR25DRAFT_196049, partial [Lindgomyces ingoldianus]
ILSLPLELREQIYKEVLANPSQGPGLLIACHDIYNEAHKFLFQRPLSFRNQSALWEWLMKVPGKHLHYVTEVTLGLEDVNLSPLLTIPIKPHGDSKPRLLTWELYEQELEKLYRVLKKLPHLKTLTIKALPDCQSFLYHGFLTTFLGHLGSLFPSLWHLTLRGNFHHQTLSFLTPLEELRYLSFDGFSSTPPTKTAEILSSLHQLTDLSLASLHALLTPADYVHRSFTSSHQSFTADVLQSINALTSFHITENIQPASPTGLYFTPQILSSLHFAHNTTLIRLSIRLLHTPDVEPLEALQEFLQGSSIQKLELDWPDFDPEDLDDLLPGALKELWVRTWSKEKAFDVLWQLIKSREAGGLYELRRVVLVR